jgi:hypothetical protein
MKKDVANIQNLLLEMYSGEWEVKIVNGVLPNGEHIATHRGYKLIIGENVAEVDRGIRGSMKLNCRVNGDTAHLSYIQDQVG